MDMAKKDKFVWYLGAACLIIAGGCWGWCYDLVVHNDD